jgi:antitoxin component YwqK of YwqJK toxin-antitoxin module
VSLLPGNLKINNMQKYIKNHNDGSLWAKGFVDSAGVEQGYWEWYRKDGSIMRSGFFKDGKQTGTWTTYDKNGRIVKVTNF